MGFQVRKRTKGKSGWLNFSYSNKRGFGASASVKVGDNITYNTRGRTTINFGNGVRYVAYSKRNKRTNKMKEPIYNSSYQREPGSNTGCLVVFIVVLVVVLAVVSLS